MKIILPRKAIIQNQRTDKNLSIQEEAKGIYNYQTSVTRNVKENFLKEKKEKHKYV